MSEKGDDSTVQGFDNPVFEDDEKKAMASSSSDHSSERASDLESEGERPTSATQREQAAVDLELVTMEKEKNGNGIKNGKDAVIDITFHDGGDTMPGANTHRKFIGG